ncbi:MAG: sulfatase-like hydrolase/transferase [Verrucomicrobia bacterium]|nr:sulfatase-like hydrolase/transferase [Verrucomicrobiota bacterium]
MKMTRRTSLMLGGSALLSACVPFPQKRVRRVLLITSDEHNPKISSVEGHPFIHTPNLQRLADRGTTYLSCYSPSPLCIPARSSFMCGKYVHETQVYNNCTLRERDFPSYGNVLKDYGVYTAHYGKKHLYRKSADLGFSEIYHGPWPDWMTPHDPNIGRGEVQPRPNADKRAVRYGPRPPEEAYRLDGPTVDEAVDWLNEKAPALDQPWLLSVNLSNPHFPAYADQELWDLYKDHEDLPEFGKEEASAQHPHAADLRTHFMTDHISEKDVRGMRRGYYAIVTYMDRQVGRLLDALEASGQLDDTLVIYTSDHGEMMGKFGMWWKSSLYDDSARIPLIISGPGFRRGATDVAAVEQLDLLATIFQFLGKPYPADWHGEPLQRMVPNDPNKVAFSEYHGHGTRSSGYILRKGEWKFIYYCGSPNQLFNMAADPDELNNLVAANPDKAAELEAELRKICDPEKESRRADEFTDWQLSVLNKDR